jgi:hypothetical protein
MTVKKLALLCKRLSLAYSEIKENGVDSGLAPE